MTQSILCTLLIIIISCGNALARQTAATGNPKETAAPAAAIAPAAAGTISTEEETPATGNAPARKRQSGRRTKAIAGTQGRGSSVADPRQKTIPAHTPAYRPRNQQAQIRLQGRGDHGSDGLLRHDVERRHGHHAHPRRHRRRRHGGHRQTLHRLFLPRQ